jgi:hypothetical protein
MLMNVGSVMFRGIVAQVFSTGLIIKFEVLWCVAIQKPEVTHLHGSGALVFDRVVDDANHGGVVDMNQSGWLWMTQFGQGES